MAQKTHPPSFGSRGHIGTDEALIVVGVVSALIALAYFVLI